MKRWIAVIAVANLVACGGDDKAASAEFVAAYTDVVGKVRRLWTEEYEKGPKGRFEVGFGVELARLVHDPKLPEAPGRLGECRALAMADLERLKDVLYGLDLLDARSNDEKRPIRERMMREQWEHAKITVVDAIGGLVTSWAQCRALAREAGVSTSAFDS